MKKLIPALVALSMVMATGAIVNAGQGNITWTVHNMSNNAPYDAGGNRHWYANNVTEVCVFCHTPHNAQPAQPLWNKVLPTQAFSMYTSSVTLSSVAKNAGQTVSGKKMPNTESLMCLSCHDGVTAINVLHNSSVVDGVSGTDKVVKIAGQPVGPTPMNISLFGIYYRANLGQTASDPYAGNNLMDDHPISFSYTAAQTEKGAAALNDISVPKSKGLRFFGTTNRLECSTCHDPHVDYGYDFDGNDTNAIAGHSPQGNHALRPFLAMSNDKSGMCLACHNK